MEKRPAPQKTPSSHSDMPQTPQRIVNFIEKMNNMPCGNVCDPGLVKLNYLKLQIIHKYELAMLEWYTKYCTYMARKQGHNCCKANHSFDCYSTECSSTSNTTNKDEPKASNVQWESSSEY